MKQDVEYFASEAIDELLNAEGCHEYAKKPLLDLEAECPLSGARLVLTHNRYDSAYTLQIHARHTSEVLDFTFPNVLGFYDTQAMLVNARVNLLMSGFSSQYPKSGLEYNFSIASDRTAFFSGEDIELIIRSGNKSNYVDITSGPDSSIYIRIAYEQSTATIQIVAQKLAKALETHVSLASINDLDAIAENVNKTVAALVRSLNRTEHNAEVPFHQNI